MNRVTGWGSAGIAGVQPCCAEYCRAVREPRHRKFFIVISTVALQTSHTNDPSPSRSSFLLSARLLTTQGIIVVKGIAVVVVARCHAELILTLNQ